MDDFFDWQDIYDSWDNSFLSDLYCKNSPKWFDEHSTWRSIWFADKINLEEYI